ncbi:MAG: hypothetical protein GY803_04785 [Chloroflexi bacterium]|nr:hypothetical protein [Chloroflexota bacterium]
MKSVIHRHKITNLFAIVGVTIGLIAGLLETLGANAWFPILPTTDVSGVITTDTTWTLVGSPYILTDTVTVGTAVTLTIEPGVTVMGQADTSLAVNGRLQAIGTPSQPITFTSATDTGAGEWYGIDFAGGDGRLEYAIVRYAGQADSNGIVIAGQPTDGPVAITNSVIMNNLGYPIQVFARDLHRLQLGDVSASGNVTDRVQVYGTGYLDNRLTRDTRLTAVPGMEGYEFIDEGLQVPNGITLTVDPGIVLMWPQFGWLYVQGHLEAVGTETQSITFTSASDTAPGEWSGLSINGTANLDHVMIRYANYNLEIWPSSQNGIVYIENSMLSDSSVYPVIVRSPILHRFQMSNVSFENNSNNRVLINVDSEYWPHELQGNATLSAQPGLEGYEIQDFSIPPDQNGYLVIPAGITLTLESGVAMMAAENVRIIAEGHLEARGTAASPVVFTSVSDSAPEQWEGLHLLGSAHLNHAIVRYADNDVLCYSDGLILIENSILSGSSEHPLYVDVKRLHNLQMNEVIFTDNAQNRVWIGTWPSLGDPQLQADATLTAQPGLEGYEIGPDSLEVPAGITLTLEAGVTLMVAEDTRLYVVGGHLEAIGTAASPVVFTSVSDSAPGQWNGLSFYGADTSAHLNHAIVRYAFYNMGISRAPDGLILIENSFLSNSADYPLVVTDGALHRLQMSNVTFVDNAVNRAIIAGVWGNYTLEGNVTLSPQPGLEGYEIGTRDDSPSPVLTVPEGLTLTVEPGVSLVPAENGQIVVGGHLEAKGTAVSPITFTSITDTNPGEWAGMVVSGTADLEYANIRYGQQNVTILDGGRATLTHADVSGAGGNGLSVSGGEATAVCTTFNANAANAVYVDGSGAPDVTVFSSPISGNGNGVNNANGNSVDARYNWWGDAGGPGGAGPGSGDTVLGNVLYTPWLTESACLWPALGFSQSSYSVYEDALTATVTVTLDIAPVLTATVDYAAVDGTAVSGIDYDLTPGTLVFPSGVTAQTIAVAILDNSALDGDKAFALQLEGQTKVSLAQDSASLTIVDDEGRYRLYLPFASVP